MTDLDRPLEATVVIIRLLCRATAYPRRVIGGWVDRVTDRLNAWSSALDRFADRIDPGAWDGVDRYDLATGPRHERDHVHVAGPLHGRVTALPAPPPGTDPAWDAFRAHAHRLADQGWTRPEGDRIPGRDG